MQSIICPECNKIMGGCSSKIDITIANRLKEVIKEESKVLILRWAFTIEITSS